MKIDALLNEHNISEEELKSIIARTTQMRQLGTFRNQESDSFTDLLNNIPDHGDVLKPLVGEVVEVTVNTKENRDSISADDRFIEVRLCKAVVDNDATGWYITSGKQGLTCLISAHTFDNLIKMNGSYFTIGLEVLRRSSTGRALICNAL